MSEEGVDERPRMYGRATTTEGEVEITVQGSADETAEDIADAFDKRVEKMVRAQGELPEEEISQEGFD